MRGDYSSSCSPVAEGCCNFIGILIFIVICSFGGLLIMIVPLLSIALVENAENVENSPNELYEFLVFDEDGNLLIKIDSKHKETECKLLQNGFIEINGPDVSRLLKLKDNYSVVKNQVIKKENEPEEIIKVKNYSIEDLRKVPEAEKIDE